MMIMTQITVIIPVSYSSISQVIHLNTGSMILTGEAVPECPQVATIWTPAYGNIAGSKRQAVDNI